MEELLKIFRAVADPTRMRILRMLGVKPLCVCEVMSVLDMAQSTTSRHLRVLLNAGLVEETPGGVWTIYRLPKFKKGTFVGIMLSHILRVEPTKQLCRDKSLAKKVDCNRLCRSKLEKRLAKLGEISTKQRT